MKKKKNLLYHFRVGWDGRDFYIFHDSEGWFELAGRRLSRVNNMTYSTDLTLQGQLALILLSGQLYIGYWIGNGG